MTEEKEELEVTKPKRKRKAVKPESDVVVAQESITAAEEPEVIVDVVEVEVENTAEPVPEIEEEVVSKPAPTKCSCKYEEFTIVRNRLGKRRVCNGCGLVK